MLLSTKLKNHENDLPHIFTLYNYLYIHLVILKGGFQVGDALYVTISVSVHLLIILALFAHCLNIIIRPEQYIKLLQDVYRGCNTVVRGMYDW